MPNWTELGFVRSQMYDAELDRWSFFFVFFHFLEVFQVFSVKTPTVVCTRLIDVRNVLIVLHFSVHHPIKKITLDLRTRLKMDKLVKLLHLISLDKQSKVVL